VESGEKNFGLDIFKRVLKQPIAGKHNGNNCVLREMQGEEGDEEPSEHHHEEREKSAIRNLRGLWN